MKRQKFVELVFGILVVEDIVAILLLVLLTAIASSETFSGAELIFSGLRLLFYIALWFVIGIFLIPIFLRKIRSLLEDETTLLVAIGLMFYDGDDRRRSGIFSSARGLRDGLAACGNPWRS